jgi:hypothetical protein
MAMILGSEVTGDTGEAVSTSSKGTRGERGGGEGGGYSAHRDAQHVHSPARYLEN